MMKVRTFTSVSTVVAALIVGCTWGTYDGSYTGGPPDGSSNGSGFVSKMVGPLGETVTSEDGVLTIDIPPGALSGTTQLTIQLETAMMSGTGVGPSYAVGPMSTQFLKPIGVSFHETLSMIGPQNVYSVTSNQQVVTLGGTTSDNRGPLIFAVTDHLGRFGVVQSNTIASSMGCNGVPNQDTCGACAKNACAMQNGQSLSDSNAKSCLCVIPARGDGILQAFEGCAAMHGGATNCMATSDIPTGGLPSTPGLVICGGSECTLPEQCCPNPSPDSRTCMNSSCNNQGFGCDEAADCPNPTIAACCNAGLPTYCVPAGTCNMPGQVQPCRTNSECPSKNCVVNRSGPCVLETCDGRMPAGWPPAGCM